MTEAQILKAILLEAPKRGCRLMRNNVGLLKDRHGNYVRYGLAIGSSDLIGWKVFDDEDRNFLAAMKKASADYKAGKGIDWKGESARFYKSIFLAVEVKGPRGRVTKKQQQFIDAVNKAGGIAGVCRSVEDFIALVG